MSNITKITATGGEVALSHEIVNKYLVSGKGKCSEQETMMFIALCKYRGLNPFLREAYLIKYSDNSPASMVVGKEAFLKRAQSNPKYKGHRTGTTEDGSMAWAEVYVDGYAVPIRCEVDYIEYVGTKDEWVNGQATGKKIVNSMWASKPKTMLRKVALCQALREAFSEDFGGMYGAEEINTVSSENLSEEILNVNPETGEITPPAEKKKSSKPTVTPPVEKDGEIKEAIFGVKTITQKAGKKTNGTDYTKFTITGDDGMVYGTFSSTDAETAKIGKNSNLKIKVKYKENQYGKTIEERGIDVTEEETIDAFAAETGVV